MFFDRLRNQAEIRIDGRESVGRLLIDVPFGIEAHQSLPAHKVLRVSLAGLGKFSEAAHVGEKDRQLAAHATQRNRLRIQQFVDDLRRNNSGKHGFHAPTFLLLEHQTVGNQAHVIHQ